jgi:protein-disulfide isomerase
MTQKNPTGKPTTPPKPTGTTTGKLSSKQLAMRKRQQKRRRNQIIITGIVVVIVAALAIVTIVSLSAPSPISNLPATSSNDVDFMTIGGADAKVTLIEYGDLRCSACVSFFNNQEPDIRNTYVKTGKIKYTMRTYPIIDMNQGVTDSQRAAQAAYCASDQKRGWDYRDVVYANSAYIGEFTGKLTDKYLKDLAKGLNLNTDTFNSCLDGNKYKQQISTEQADGAKKGVNGTPTFFLKYLDKEEVVSVTDLKAKIEDALNKTK